MESDGNDVRDVLQTTFRSQSKCQRVALWRPVCAERTTPMKHYYRNLCVLVTFAYIERKTICLIKELNLLSRWCILKWLHVNKCASSHSLEVARLYDSEQPSSLKKKKETLDWRDYVENHDLRLFFNIKVCRCAICEYSGGRCSSSSARHLLPRLRSGPLGPFSQGLIALFDRRDNFRDDTRSAYRRSEPPALSGYVGFIRELSCSTK